MTPTSALIVFHRYLLCHERRQKLRHCQSCSGCAFNTNTKQVREAMGIILEDREKHAWHDLRKDIDDLPEREGVYWVHGTMMDGSQQEGSCCYTSANGFEDWDGYVIAWREVEPFEGDIQDDNYN